MTEKSRKSELLDELIAPVENHSCCQRRPDPSAVAEPASPLAG